MSLNLDKKGLKSIIRDFDLFFIDIWGVIHNGIKLFKNSIVVLNEIEKLNKEYVLLTNAPRPNNTVIKFLRHMGLDENKCKNVFTSGEASLEHLNNNYQNLKFFHIGPPRDFDLFKLLENNKVKNINESDFILCTGFFDNYKKNLNFYKNFLKNESKKKMVCTNPDLIVDRGDEREYCAGTIAKLFEELGGVVEYFGKPYSLVYNLSAKVKNKKVLCIGDNLNTDIKGANLQNFKSLLILSGIHNNEADLEKLLKNYGVRVDYTQSYLKW
tara:strand:+ start:672 stop:1481 length:810 start_codon:yes stop_codon:yes gene_type:complete